VTDTLRRIIDTLVESFGYRPGTSLENRVAFRLGRWGHKPPAVAQQHRVGRYRLDFAWPDLLIALEVDGWHHQRPESAARDAHRDADLREQGWLTFRVHDTEELILQKQLCRVVQVVNALRADGR
jgi:very-short-patch-repair endonuclease